MAVYLIGFALSVGLIAFGEKKRLPVFLGISALALLIPCLIAGLRAENIGTDVTVYVKQLTRCALVSDDLKDYFNCYWYAEWRNLYVKDYELGFSFLVYVVANIAKNMGAVLFAIQALTVLPIYIALSRNRQKMPVWFGMLLYYFLFYNSTLNMMRQWIAMGFLLLAFQLLLEKRGWLTAVFTAVAFLFHTSAILAVPIYLVYFLVWLPGRSKLVHGHLQVRISTVVAALFLCAGVLVLLNLSLVVRLLTSLGMDRFSVYLEGGQMRLLVTQIVLRLPLAVVLLLCWRELRDNCPAATFYLAMLFFDLVASQLASVDENAIRISTYFSVFSLLWLPTMVGYVRPGAKRTLVIAGISVYAMAYWYYFYVMTLRHATYPYAFASLFS